MLPRARIVDVATFFGFARVLWTSVWLPGGGLTAASARKHGTAATAVDAASWFFRRIHSGDLSCSGRMARGNYALSPTCIHSRSPSMFTKAMYRVDIT